MITMSDVRAANQKYFGRGEKRFFGDITYWLLTGKSGKKYVLRSTYAWSDMFGQPRKIHYYINPVNPDLTIEHILPNYYNTRDEAKEWIKTQG